ILLEGLVEAANRNHPLLAALFDCVKLVLHAGGELDVQYVGEGADEEIGDQKTETGRPQPLALVLVHVLALQDRAHDRGLRRRPADAFLLELLDERRLRVARRRLGEVLLRYQLEELQHVALVELWQGSALALFVLAWTGAVVAPFCVDADEAVEAHHLTGRAE